MIPARSFRELLREARQRLEHARRRVQVVGIMFCRPQLRLAKESVLPHLAYWHQRSGEALDMYFAGFSTYDWDGPSDFSYKLDGPDGTEWRFNEAHFNRWRSDFEKLSGWRYSGGNDLVLTTIRADERGEPYVDLGSTITVNLEDLMSKSSSDEVSLLVERLVRLAESADRTNPVWDVSDALGAETARSALANAFMSILPDALRKDAQRARTLVVQDLRLRDQRAYERHLDTEGEHDRLRWSE